MSEFPKSDRHQITSLLSAMSDGDRSAYDRLFAQVYPELRRIARSLLSGEKAALSTAPTALVHEVYCRLIHLVGEGTVPWENRKQFFALVARAMRRMLVDMARARTAERRGSGVEHEPADDSLISPEAADHIVRLDEALKALKQVNEEAHDVVELQYFCGFTYEEIAEILCLSHSTVRRRWQFAKSWLFVALRDRNPT